MRVKELISELQKLDQDLEVYVSGDSEGNSFIRMAGAWEYFTNEDTGSYELEQIFQEDEFQEYGVELEDCRKVVVIWP